MIISDRENISRRHYNTVHQTLRRYWKKSGVCEFCKDKTVTQWANKRGKYVLDRSEWYELCKDCHFEYDKKQGIHRGRPKKKA